MPSDPVDATRDAFATRGAQLAASSAQSLFVRTAKGYVPRWAWPLIPGAGGSVTDNLQASAKRTVWGWIGGCVFSLVFFGLVGLVLTGVAIAVGWAVMFG